MRLDLGRFRSDPCATRRIRQQAARLNVLPIDRCACWAALIEGLETERPMTNRHDYIAELLEMVDKAEGHCDLPWRQRTTRPTNLSSLNPYRGINRINLMIAQIVLEYSSGYWLTFKQALSLDGCVRKGQKGRKILYYSPIPEEKQKPDGPTFVIRYASVFNLDQIDGIELPDLEAKPQTIDPHETARAFCTNIPVPVIHGDNGAFYSPSRDEIHMPAETDFHDTDSATASQHYLSVLLHEMAHSTGHKTRLDRFSGERTKQSVAYEELIAEAAASLLCLELGIEATISEDHAKYLASWKSAIKDDPFVLVRAMSAAEKAIDVLNAYQEQSMEQAA